MGPQDCLPYPLASALPLVTVGLPIGGRDWQVTCVQNQDLLLDAAENLEYFPYGLLLWEAGVALARHLLEGRLPLSGRQVLELGAGVGLPGIVARSGGAEVWQTDHLESALALSRFNAMQNGVSGIRYFRSDWTTWTHETRYDLVLGADILYQRDMHYYLEAIFRRNVAPGGALLLSDPGRPQALEFAASLEKHGWAVLLETEVIVLSGQPEPQRPVEVALYTVTRLEAPRRAGRKGAASCLGPPHDPDGREGSGLPTLTATSQDGWQSSASGMLPRCDPPVCPL